MQDDNKMTSVYPSAPGAQPESSSTVGVHEAALLPHEKTFETALFAFGILAVLSLILNQGFVLKLSAALFLMVAVIAIVRSLTSSKKVYNVTPVELAQVKADAVSRAGRSRSLLKILGITVIVIVAVPVLGYVAMYALLIIVLFSGGGRMGS
jgi:hypothetical protein